MGSESILIHFICVLMTKTLNSFLGSTLPCWKLMLKYDIADYFQQLTKNLSLCFR